MRFVCDRADHATAACKVDATLGKAVGAMTACGWTGRAALLTLTCQQCADNDNILSMTLSAPGMTRSWWCVHNRTRSCIVHTCTLCIAGLETGGCLVDVW